MIAFLLYIGAEIQAASLLSHLWYLRVVH